MLLAMQQADTSGITRDSRNGGGVARLALYFYMAHAVQHVGIAELRPACASKVMRKVSWPGPCYRVPILHISIGSMHDRHVIGNGAAVLELRGSDKDRGSKRHLRHK